MMWNMLGWGVGAGVVGTIVMDVSAPLIAKTGLRGVDPVLAGKWMQAISEGRFINENILAAPAPTLSPVVGLLVHYGIGATLGAVFALLLAQLGPALSRPILFGILYGAATSVFAWFLMFPSMGFGPFGMSAPPDLHLFSVSLLRHIAYGLGLGLFAHFAIVPRLLT